MKCLTIREWCGLKTSIPCNIDFFLSNLLHNFRTIAPSLVYRLSSVLYITPFYTICFLFYNAFTLIMRLQDMRALRLYNIRYIYTIYIVYTIYKHCVYKICIFISWWIKTLLLYYYYYWTFRLVVPIDFCRPWSKQWQFTPLYKPCSHLFI